MPFDAQAVKGEVPKIAGLRAVSNFPAEVERKLFIHNLGHAALAYLGYREGYTYIHEAIKDEKDKKNSRWGLGGSFSGSFAETP